MKLSEYKELIKDLSVGKRLPDALYVHQDLLSSLPEPIGNLVEQVRENLGVLGEGNVVKFSLSEFKLSFLSYPDFVEAPHPQLQQSISVDLSTGKVRRFDYQAHENPPILHRKELLVGEDHPMRKTFESLTREEEQAGLYSSGGQIGFKKNWEKLLLEKGLTCDGHRLVENQDASPKKTKSEVVVERHKTAIVRKDLSRPVKALVEYGLLNESNSFFDYGCGLGSDIEGLEKMGIQARGWDPVYRPNDDLVESDVVNLGYVLNVIEDMTERVEVLSKAFKLTHKVLAVSAQILGTVDTTAARPYKDGVITQKKTFQKYFTQEELRRFIEDVLHCTAQPVDIGTFLVFRSPIDRQAFVSSRSKRHIDWEAMSLRLFPDRKPRISAQLYEQHKDILEAFWERMISLGRLPKEGECEEYDVVCGAVGSARKARSLFIQKYGEDTLERAYESRRNDLLVYLALSNFRKPVPYKHIPLDLQNDIKSFFGNYKAAVMEGKKALYSIADAGSIAQHCSDTPFGVQDDQALYVHNSLIDELTPLLRIYVGCAGVLFGDVHAADVIKIHKRSGKVTLLRYDDFEGNPLPELQTRIKVNLREQRIDVFDHTTREDRQLLFFKERFVAEHYPAYSKWLRYGNRLRKLGFREEIRNEPNKKAFTAFLEAQGLTKGLAKKRANSR